MISATDLAAMLCSRLCHDLLSPVGALNNGLELLADETDPEMRARCLQLLEQSARASAHKLKFFRLAYGAAGGFAEQVPTAEPEQLLRDLVGANERLTLDWQVPMPTMGKPMVKILLNLAALGADSLVRGGTLAIGAERTNGTTEIAVRAEGPRIAFDEALTQALEGRLSARDLSSRNAPAHMIAMLAAEQGGKLLFARLEGALVLGALVPEGEGLIG